MEDAVIDFFFPAIFFCEAPKGFTRPASPEIGAVPRPNNLRNAIRGIVFPARTRIGVPSYITQV